MSAAKPPVCDYEGSDYQARFWESGEREYEDRVEAIALRRLLPAQGERILEIGAGAGRNTPRYSGYKQVALLDYSRTQLEQAQARLGQSKRYLYIVADVYRMPFAPGVFDAATMIRTLHHMAAPQAALGQIRQCLARDAAFILEFASKRHLKSIARWLLRRQRWNPFSPDPVEFARLNFDFHPRSVQTWLYEAGFSVQRRLTVSHFRLALLKRVIPLGVLVQLDAWLQWTGALWQLTPSVFVRSVAIGDPGPAPAGVFWRCPACGSVELSEGDAIVRCESCRRGWGCHAGIYDFKEPLQE
jgi:ubiquinone/menaquinone biosynthesis C-methylase UbiE